MVMSYYWGRNWQSLKNSVRAVDYGSHAEHWLVETRLNTALGEVRGLMMTTTYNILLL